MSRQGAPACPKCGGMRVVNITHRRRPTVIDGATWRGHECLDCGHRYASIQRVATDADIARAS